MRIYLLILLTIICLNKTNCKNIDIIIEPPSWWVGMKNPELQLMIYGKDISSYEVKCNSNSVTIKDIIKTSNPNYLFIDIVIDESAQAGTLDFIFTKKGKTYKMPYILQERKPMSSERQGFDTSDVIYLLMPDRFVNGNKKNDNIIRMKEKTNLLDPDGRHGGDIQGIIDSMNYFNDMGYTALWLNPVLENNNDAYSYHGYAITDFYNIDPRFGDNTLYKEMVNQAHRKGIKVIKDMVFNHFGEGHRWYEELPDSSWINRWDNFTRSNYRGSVISDPYSSQYDKDIMTKGWFDTSMPDLNQENPLVANYLIQNAIWWVEYADLDGIRMDTYPYSDEAFMKQWMLRMKEEYPNLSIVGEAWLNNKTQVAFWQDNDFYGNDSNLDFVMDFPLQSAIVKAFTTDEGWDSGMAALYESLSQDFAYPNPNNILIFMDNHDLSRIFSLINKDFDKWKMATAFLLTTRGIPQIWMGTELLNTGFEWNGHGKMRQDFNTITDDVDSVMAYEARNYMKTLLNYRKNSDVLQNGKLLHFIPHDGIYTYFRYNDNDAVMVILNNNDDEMTIDTERYNEILRHYHTGKDIITNKRYDIKNPVTIKPHNALILELQ